MPKISYLIAGTNVKKTVNLPTWENMLIDTTALLNVETDFYNFEIKLKNIDYFI